MKQIQSYHVIPTITGWATMKSGAARISKKFRTEQEARAFAEDVAAKKVQIVHTR